jgi:sucrose-6-phosphate hydrolase SacC (GH32 family)
MQERNRDQGTVADRHWANALSLPRVLVLGDDSRLRFAPVAEVASLRGRHRRFADIDLAGGRAHRLPGVSGACLEIQAEIELGAARQCRLAVLCSGDGREQTPIVYDAREKTISLGEAGEALVLGDREALELRVFVDRSLVEVYTNRRACLSAWTYPRQADSAYVDLLAIGGTAGAKSVDVWEMRPAID